LTVRTPRGTLWRLGILTAALAPNLREQKPGVVAGLLYVSLHFAHEAFDLSISGASFASAGKLVPVA